MATTKARIHYYSTKELQVHEFPETLRKYMGFQWKTKKKNQCRFAKVTSYNWKQIGQKRV